MEPFLIIISFILFLVLCVLCSINNKMKLNTDLLYYIKIISYADDKKTQMDMRLHKNKEMLEKIKKKEITENVLFWGFLIIGISIYFLYRG